METNGHQDRAGQSYTVDTIISGMEVRQMKRYLKIAAAFMLAVLLSMQLILPVKAWDEIITCTVLGDSIAKGYSSDKVNKIKCYGRIVTERLAEENGTYFDYQNYAKNGLDTRGLNEKVLSRDTVKRNLNKSDIILLTMGSNDLLNEFKREAQEILNSDTKFRSANQALTELKEGVKKNPLTVLKIVDALSNWDYASFETQWMQAMDTITQQKKEDAQIIVTNIYNPLYNMELPGTLNKVVNNIIKNMNTIIEKRAADYNYKVINLFDSAIAAFVQGDGLHPSQEGQQMIADMVYKIIEDPGKADDNSRTVDGEAIKGEAVKGETIKGEAIKEEAIEESEDSSTQNKVTEQDKNDSSAKTETKPRGTEDLKENESQNQEKKQSTKENSGTQTKENRNQTTTRLFAILSIIAVILAITAGIRIYKK